MALYLFAMSARLTGDQKLEILKQLDDGISERTCASKFQVGKGTINRLKGSRWTFEGLAKEPGYDLKKRKN